MQRQRNVIVIYSPHSGRSAQLSQALTSLQHVEVNVVQMIPIADLDNLPPQGTYWREKGIDVAIAAGGDGLVGGVITHIAESGLPLGILPLGTANDIARSLHIPLDLAEVAKVIALGKEVEVDIGEAQPAEQAPHIASPRQEGPVLSHISPQKHGFFAHALTVGLNVQFARLATNVAIRQRYGRLTYPFAAFEVLEKHEPIEVDLQLEGVALPPANMFTRQQHRPVSALEEMQTSFQCRALQVAVINAPIFGGQWRFTVPQANMSDRLLDIVVIEDIDLEKLTATIAQFFSSQKQHSSPPSGWGEQHVAHHPAELTGIPGIHHIQAREVTIKTKADPRDATLDGEVRGQTPMYARLANERLRVVVPG
ncbi:MAG: diacylglycerol/lipid kinase family protein [Ktedonobacteraceae bacterium]